MPITSDITLSPSAFAAESISEETRKINAIIQQRCETGPSWYKLGAPAFRDLLLEGKTAFPIPNHLPNAKTTTIPSRDAGRTIPLRVCTPGNAQPSRAILLHMHPGGFVLGSHDHQDANLQHWSNTLQITAISIGYRLAPEHPFPAAVHDCLDAAIYLVDNGPSIYGCPVLLMLGESAGANLVAATAFHLIRTRPVHQLAAVVFPFGVFDMTLNLPQACNFERYLLLNSERLREFAEVYVPGLGVEERRDTMMSPVYEDLVGLARQARGGKLPAALFVCGTADPLLDDSVVMGYKWLGSGSEAVVKIYPGAVHAFTMLEGYGPGLEAKGLMVEFMRERLDGFLEGREAS
ncbi:hypothetical protein OQA88_12337 [Cercophora sp. LCS_1]